MPSTANCTALCVDVGNTLVKMAVVKYNRVISSASFLPDHAEAMVQWLNDLQGIDACILSSVGAIDKGVMDKISRCAPFFIELTAETPIPIQNHYKTPETLGKDRLAAVIGAHSLYPGHNLLVIDAGTALKIDFLDSAANYHGGNISPGLQMRFQALHDYTQRLPLCTPKNDYPFLGNSTNSAIVAGVQNSMLLEMEGYISLLTIRHPDLITIITGGDAFFFVNRMEKPIFAQSDLIFIGLNQIVWHNCNLRKKQR